MDIDFKASIIETIPSETYHEFNIKYTPDKDEAISAIVNHEILTSIYKKSESFIISKLWNDPSPNKSNDNIYESITTI